MAVTNRAKLDYKMDYLVVRTEEATKRVHLSEISVLLIESTAVSLTAYLLCELTRRKIDVIFCDEKRAPYGTLAPFYGSHDTSMKFRSQIRWNDTAKASVWTEIVRAKISGQAAVLKAMNCPEAGLLETYILQIQEADSTNREGHAAKVYFNALFGMSFSRSVDNTINAALNYGYSLILSAFAREAAVCGYATQLGIFHDNMFNQFNLACDLMEPFRPFVDYEVKLMAPEKFEHDEKMKLVRLLNHVVMIDGRSHYMMNAMSIYAKSIFDALGERDISLIKFPCYELQIHENDSVL
ncbi:MAG: type II CRISPR-associated endonuclease Cas1 [Synergistes jonesii]|uniref:type II CRISPR-associated endonuclease Cas1 n=1 Tax=Synergistes jonesii TaxID=2754 RepID=UPI002A757779|nr:type II CRISPR-associated endonuclease Cas1 [Synergistes jonesii]MDY2984887.1 type II CRISPR-associated endonuclease Cas1 [Synergistes jonesii]